MKYLGVRWGQAWDPASEDARHSEGAGQGSASIGGRDGCRLRLQARQQLGHLGPGETQMLSLFSSLLPKVDGGCWRGHREEPRGPQGLLRSSQGGRVGDICSPGCRLQGLAWALGRDFTAPACRPPGLGSRGSWWGGWVD